MNGEEYERLTKPYKEHLRETLKTVEDYRGYLDACHAEGPETFALAVQDVFDFIAAAMRDKCVEAVNEFGEWVSCRCSECKLDGRAHAVDVHASLANLAAGLQSLTLDQVQEKQ